MAIKPTTEVTVAALAGMGFATAVALVEWLWGVDVPLAVEIPGAGFVIGLAGKLAPTPGGGAHAAE